MLLGINDERWTYHMHCFTYADKFSVRVKTEIYA